MNLREALQENPYQGYAYSYPHKLAYRELMPAIPLQTLWQQENRNALFLYVHIPFCEMRCGFCNLFTMANPKEDLVSLYLMALKKQARVVKEALGESHFSRLAVGGGTPSFLDEPQLEQLFYILEDLTQARPCESPFSFEVSPKTITPAKLRYLHEKGVDRISIGIQSFLEEEVKGLGRPQNNREVHQALTWIKQEDFPVLNMDLIYGGAGQTAASWQQTLEQTLQYQPEEIYLYPLYVRPLTGLEKMGMSWDNFRLRLYRQGRDLLLDRGYEQLSMRMFRARHAPKTDHTLYCCQEDGMVGLGAGARSYTRHVHYATEYAVGRKGVRGIIQDFTERGAIDFAAAQYGIRLSPEEQKRRFIIKSLLHTDGLSLGRYVQVFGNQAMDEFPQLNELLLLNLATVSAEGNLLLSPGGLERSDTIGPWLYSADIHALMQQFELQ
jgi:oxygen-independent coproporphyrinogen-3 oxidase